MNTADSYKKIAACRFGQYANLLQLFSLDSAGLKAWNQGSALHSVTLAQ